MHLLTKATAAGVIIALGACGGAPTPAARWSSAERAQIEQSFPGCEFVEDKAARSAGYACDLGTMRAYDLGAPEDHAALARRLAEAKAAEPFTAPLAELVAREPLTIGDVTLAASIATYQPTEGTIVPPEAFVVLSPERAGRQAFSCAVTIMANIDGADAISARIAACLDGLRLLVEASR